MKRFLFITATAFGLLSPTWSWSAEKLFFLRPVEVDPSAPYPENIKKECAVEMLLENYSLSQLGRQGEVQAITNPSEANGGKVFKLTLLSVSGYGGGGWSGPKSLSMRVDVTQDGKTIKSTVLDRSSTGGAWGGFKGTCSIFDRITKVLSQDMGRWYFGVPKAKQESTEKSAPETQ
jgi:hypothetical protein